MIVRGAVLDVNQNGYTRVGFDRKAEAVNGLDLAFQVTYWSICGVAVARVNRKLLKRSGARCRD